MIDIHCHILPGLDDGPATLEESLALARAAAEGGTETIVATPHIRGDHPFDPAEVVPATARLNEALDRERIPLRVLPGGELSISRAAELDRETLASAALDGGPYILVESPYTHLGGLLEETLFDLQVQGFHPVLAHPERSPSFQKDSRRLIELVRKGILCSVTAGSVTGRFGKSVRQVTLDLIRGGVAHNVASDAHDLRSRHPALQPALTEIESRLMRIPGYGSWLTGEVPRAILSGRGVPPRPRRERGASRPAHDPVPQPGAPLESLAG